MFPMSIDPAMADRLEGLEAILIAVRRKDELIEIVSEAETADVARDAVMAALSISKSAATTVLGLQIYRLSKEFVGRYLAERNALRLEYKIDN